MSGNGWIDPDKVPAKRQRFSDTGNGKEDIELLHICKKRGTTGGNERRMSPLPGPSSSLTSTPVQQSETTPVKMELPEARQDCRYGSSCYRRNEAHLIEYRHRLRNFRMTVTTK